MLDLLLAVGIACIGALCAFAGFVAGRRYQRYVADRGEEAR